MTSSIIKKLSAAEINEFIHLSEIHTHSFIGLQSFFGYSQSELEIDLKNKQYGYFAVAIYSKIVFAFNVFNIDQENHTAQIQIIGAIGDHRNLVLECINKILKINEIYKLYSFLREGERNEEQSLITLGFCHEGQLKEHYYVSGCYEDLKIYGLFGGKDAF